MQVMLKIADISNEMRPHDVASPWLDCLLAEFFNQVCMTHVASWPLDPCAQCAGVFSLLCCFANMLDFPVSAFYT